MYFKEWQEKIRIEYQSINQQHNLNPNLTHEEQPPNLGFHQTTTPKETSHTCWK